MRPGPHPVPLFVICRNRKCEAVIEVTSKADQLATRFCDDCETERRRVMATRSFDQQRAAAQKSAEARRAKALARFPTMTATEIYWHGYRRGYNAGQKAKGGSNHVEKRVLGRL